MITDRSSSPCESIFGYFTRQVHVNQTRLQVPECGQMLAFKERNCSMDFDDIDIAGFHRASLKGNRLCLRSTGLE